MITFVGLSLQSLHYGKYGTREASWYDETKASTVSTKQYASRLSLRH